MYSVLVTRPQPAADELAERLRREGFRAAVAPMTEYIALAALDTPDMTSYQALVFSSAEAVRVFSASSSAPNRSLPVLAVGESTAETARRAGFINVYSGSGGSEDIVGLLRTHAATLSLKKVLHPCSEDTPADIGHGAAEFGVEVVRRSVYKAQFLDVIPEEALRVLRRGDLHAAVFFSARAAANFMKLVGAEGLRGAVVKLDFICISKRVAAALDPLSCPHLHVAERPDMESVLDVLRRLAEAKKAAKPERRERPERRVQNTAYAGEDRRRGRDRRAHEMRQEERVLQEKIGFLNRTVLTFAFMFIAIVLAGVFMMAPEYLRLQERAALADKLEKKLSAMGDAVRGRFQKPPPEETSFGGALNSRIEKIKNAGDSVTEVADGIVSSAATAITTRAQPAFAQMFDMVAALRQIPGGEAAITQSLKTLRSLLSATPDKPADISQTIDVARRHDKTLDAVLSGIGGNDLAAAAMLLTLNEFRGNVSRSRPYADDLALLQKFSGNDPALNEALRRLAPYAEKGVMSRERLQSEFKGLAADVALAKMAGQDISVPDAAAKRLDKLGNIKGQKTGADPAVARAQILLDRGDVSGAMQELRTLEGAAAKAAEPWMDNAAGHVVAGPAADQLTQAMLQATVLSLPGGEFSMESFFSTIKDKMHRSSVPYLSPALQNNNADNMGVLAPRAP